MFNQNNRRTKPCYQQLQEEVSGHFTCLTFLTTISFRYSVNIREDEKNYVLELAVPGIDKNNLKIDINEDVLTISSESKNETEENKDGYKRKEFSYSSFCRSFYIPENVDREKIEAGYKDGILSVGLPKQEVEKNKITRQVKIS
jgi:HSP20 family protein